MRIGIVTGSNRDGALSRKLAHVVGPMYDSLIEDVDILDLADMDASFLANDAYKNPSESVSALVERFMACDGVVFIVPEYNGSYPGVLKLFIDMFPYPGGFDSRPCAFIGLAAGHYQGLRAVEHLQGVAGYRNAHCFARRCFIGSSYSQFDGDGKLTDEELGARLFAQAKGFVAYVEAMATTGQPAKER